MVGRSLRTLTASVWMVSPMKILAKLNPDIAALKPYEPGKPIEEVARELGMDPADIIKLASNESALGTSPRALAAIRRGARESFLYPDGSCYTLTGKLAAHLGVGRDQLIIGNGSNEVLELVAHCFLNHQTSAVFSQYAFIVYKLVSVLFGARMREVPCAPGLQHDLDAMLAAITDDTTVVFICNPNNPTSTILTPEQVYRFMDRVPDHVLVVFDEAYQELALAPMPDTLQYVRAQRNVLVCRTFSKAYGLAGLRLGYGIGPAPLIRALHQARQPFNVNSLAQVAGTAALDDQAFVARGHALYAKGKAWLEAQLGKLGVPFIPAFANFILIEVGDGQRVFVELQKLGVIVRPVGGYGLPRHIRVTFGTMAQNRRFVAALKQVLGK